MIPVNGYTVIYEAQFTNAELAAVPFALSSKGDEVVLSAATNNRLTGYRTQVKFGAAANGVSFGRYVTSDGREEFVALSARTFGRDDPGSPEEFRTGTGAANAYPRVGPVVISEVMYHPPDLGTNDNTRDEFIELHNITTAPVALYDPMYPTNGWRLRGAVDFDFVPGTVIEPGGILLVVGFDPVNNPAALAEFRSTYHLVPGIEIVGPWRGRLANDSDDIELRRPDAPDTNGTPSILVERVRYSDSLPWPTQADGTGFSLQRRADDAFANDPVNWTADSPTPGPAASSVDTDGDGMQDLWEMAHGFDPFNPADAGLDPDGDGLTNLQESQLGTNPRDPTDGPPLDITLTPDGAGVILSFTAIANFAYAIEYTEAWGTPWRLLRNFPAAATHRVIHEQIEAGTAPQCFYRLRVGTVLASGPLLIDSIQPAGGNQVTLTFTVPPNSACTVEHSAALIGGSWASLTNYPAAPASRLIEFSTPTTSGRSFFRLRSP